MRVVNVDRRSLAQVKDVLGSWFGSNLRLLPPVITGFCISVSTHIACSQETNTQWPYSTYLEKLVDTRHYCGARSARGPKGLSCTKHASLIDGSLPRSGIEKMSKIVLRRTITRQLLAICAPSLKLCVLRAFGTPPRTWSNVIVLSHQSACSVSWLPTRVYHFKFSCQSYRIGISKLNYNEIITADIQSPMIFLSFLIITSCNRLSVIHQYDAKRAQTEQDKIPKLIYDLR